MLLCVFVRAHARNRVCACARALCVRQCVCVLACDCVFVSEIEREGDSV